MSGINNKCDGRCSMFGDCRGEVRRVSVYSGNGRRNWGEYSYCDVAVQTDTKNGYLVKVAEPNKST